jgi:hypothetical protein
MLDGLGVDIVIDQPYPASVGTREIFWSRYREVDGPEELRPKFPASPSRCTSSRPHPAIWKQKCNLMIDTGD